MHRRDLENAEMSLEEWNYGVPEDDRDVLACGHAGPVVAYFAEGEWWESWGCECLNRDNVRP